MVTKFSFQGVIPVMHNNQKKQALVTEQLGNIY